MFPQGEQLQTSLSTMVAFFLFPMEKEQHLLFSIHGKAISGVINRAHIYNIPVYLIAGGSKLSEKELKAIGIKGVSLLANKAKDLEDSMQNADKYVKECAKDLIAQII